MAGDESENQMFTEQFLAVWMEIGNYMVVVVVVYEYMSICE